MKKYIQFPISKSNDASGKDRKETPVRAFLLLLCALLLSAATASADAVDDFTSSPGLTPEATSLMIIDLRDGTVVADYNSTLPLVPASIMKAVTIGGLLNETGPNFRYRTPVEITGKLSDGVLDGNLIITGSGDPSLNSRHVPHNPDLCSEIGVWLKKAGISVIKGKVKIDQSVWSGPAVSPTWAAGDLSKNYGTGQHGLNFADNASGKASVANPAGVFLSSLGRELAAKGITLGREDIADYDRRPLFTHQSVPIDEIMRSCMMRSDNQYAEAMLRTIAVRDGQPGSFDNGAARNTRFWQSKKMPMEGVRIVDGSGLSRSNRITARFMAGVLKSLANNPYYASFFPLAGQEGTLRNFLAKTPLDSYVAMKTGSMNGIQCYAGYVLDDDYVPTHVVVFMMNDLRNRDRARKDAEKLLLRLFAPEALQDESDTPVQNGDVSTNQNF